MAKGCNCAGSSCGCLLTAGGGITITGIGTAANPFVISAVAPDLADIFTIDDTLSVNMTLLGSGTTGDPFILSATASLGLLDLTDVEGGTPATGEGLIWDGAQWTFAAVGGGGGGAVSSVNSQTGVVVLGADNIAESATRKWLTAAERVIIGGAAADSAVVKLTGAQTIAGIKTFSSAPVVPDASFAQAKVSGLAATLALLAPLASPALTGVPTAPAPTVGSSIATKDYVDANIGGVRPAVLVPIIWTGSAWAYKGVAVSGRPSDITSTDTAAFIGNPGGTLPSWAATNDVWIQG
jgi:hypothetical protein